MALSVAKTGSANGQPMRFGKKNEKGIVMRDHRLAVATIGADGTTDADVLVHDAREPDPSIAFWLSRFEPPTFPVVVGVLRSVERPTYEEGMKHQIEAAREKRGRGDLNELINSGDVWTVA
jgi:2-oxoglutarate ferredoxin oxidoreductase subunit beta